MKLTFKQLTQSIVAASLVAAGSANAYYKGVDLSYVNEMEDCGATYYENGQAKDPFEIFSDQGANVVRVRLWHDPTARSALPSSYSGYQDVVATIQRAKAAGMRVMLDFHYSDNWTDPGEQVIPAAWHHLINDTDALAAELYNYTYQTLTDLNNMGLMPELVQVGNETNGNILSDEGADLYPVDFNRQAQLLNAGLQAVNDAAQQSSIKPKTILHIADPNNGEWWYSGVRDGGIQDYDIIGLSFYPEWHAGTVSQIGDIVANLKSNYGKEVMIVEVGSPWTSDNKDTAPNMMTILPPGYGAPSIANQRDFLVDLANEVYNRGGYGTLYWEPAWVSTGCQTQWGTGSHWDNATFFDFNNNLIPNGGVEFLQQTYGDGSLPDTGHGGQTVTFKVDMNNSGTSGTPYITGSFSGDSSWQMLAMTDEGNGIYSYTTSIAAGETGGYFFLSGNDWASRETVPSECALMWGNDRQYTVTTGENVFAYQWASCDEIKDPTDHSDIGNVTFRVDMNGAPATPAYITGQLGNGNDWQIVSMLDEGNNIYSFTTNLAEGTEGAYYFLSGSDWADRESVPSECALMWGVDRQFIVGSGYNTFAFKWASCGTTGGGSSGGSSQTNGTVNGTYRITPLHSGMALDVAGCSSANAANMQQWSWLNNDCQKFVISTVDGIWHRISPVNAPSKGLDVDSLSTSNGANIMLWDYWGGANQQFRFQSAGSGKWRIVNRNSELCLDVSGNSATDGANLIQWSCSAGANNQIFELVRQ